MMLVFVMLMFVMLTFVMLMFVMLLFVMQRCGLRANAPPYGPD
jgi:heme/copper-type cytochrome/quinol oxidase subunit 2